MHSTYLIFQKLQKKIDPFIGDARLHDLNQGRFQGLECGFEVIHIATHCRPLFPSHGRGDPIFP